MTDTTIEFLNSQIESEEVWQADSKRAEACVKLEHTIKVGLGFYELFRGFDELWSRQVQAGSTPFDPKMAEALHRVYTWWLLPCDRVFKEIVEYEKDGFEVVGAAELHAAYRSVKSILRTNVQEVIDNFPKARRVA